MSNLYDPASIPSVSALSNLLDKYSAPRTPGVKNPGNQFNTSRSPLSRAGGLSGMMSRKANTLSAKSTGGRMVPAQSVRPLAKPPAVKSLTPANPLRPPKAQTPITPKAMASPFKAPKLASSPSPVGTGLANAASFLIKAPLKLPFAKTLLGLGALGASVYGGHQYLKSTEGFRDNIKGQAARPAAYLDSVRREFTRQNELRRGTSDFDPETSRRRQGIYEGAQQSPLNRSR
jgi:hypothetical protein